MYSFLTAIMATFLSMTVAYISAQLSLLEKTLPGGRSAFGHIAWLVTPVAIAFLAFVYGVFSAMHGIS